jgi:hypothetical protein
MLPWHGRLTMQQQISQQRLRSFGMQAFDGVIAPGY